MPMLTAKERAILILRSLREKRPEDPLWRRTIPLAQGLEFNRLIVLMNACNIYLPLYITVVQHTEQLYLRFYWWQTLVNFGGQVWRVAELLPRSKRKQAEDAVGDSLPVSELPWDEEEHELSWLNVSDRMEETVRFMLVSLWQELRSIDIILDEVAKEFDGEDPLHPVMRSVVEQTRSKLMTMHTWLSVVETIDLTEPDEATMELARSYFENGRTLMDRI